MSDRWVDFRTIKASVPIERILARYGATLKLSGIGHLRGVCPLPTHTSDKTRLSFIVNVDKNVWACQSASCVSDRGGKIGGNNLDLIVAMEGCSIYQAALVLEEWFGVGDRQTNSGSGPGLKMGSNHRSPAILENKPLPFVLSDLDFQHPYLLHRRISSQTARHFEAGYYSGPGTMASRVAIPIHNRDGKLVAYAGRSIDDSLPKYRFPAGFRKSQELYNLHRVLASAHCKRVIVVEGFFDCWKVYQSGFPSVVALMGCALSTIQASFLEAHFDEVTLLLDGDLAGKTATAIIGKRLYHKLRIQVGHVPIGTQPDRLSKQELTSLVCSTSPFGLST